MPEPRRASRVSLSVSDRPLPVSPRTVQQAAERALREVGRPAGAVAIALVDDAEIRRLNREFRGVGRRTDVLAFPLEVADAPTGLVGQIVISVDTARRQSRRLGVSLALELELLVTHGVLHLVGYDDRDPLEATLMHRRERDILASGVRRVPARLWKGLLHG